MDVTGQQINVALPIDFKGVAASEEVAALVTAEGPDRCGQGLASACRTKGVFWTNPRRRDVGIARRYAFWKVFGGFGGKEGLAGVKAPSFGSWLRRPSVFVRSFPWRGGRRCTREE